MGRGRTTTGMIAASVIATIEAGHMTADTLTDDEDEYSDTETGESAAAAQYLNGELVVLGPTVITELMVPFQGSIRSSFSS